MAGIAQTLAGLAGARGRTECTRSADGRRLTCQFVQVGVRLQTQPGEIETRIREELKKATASDWKELSELPTTDMCKEKSLRELRDAVNKQPLADKERRFFEGMLARQRALCDKPTRETLVEFMKFMGEWESKTCRIWTNPYKETFEWQPGGKWVGNRGPSGPCGVIVVSTLEPHDKNSKVPVLWTYETRKIVTNKEGLGAFCKFDEKPVRYSWKGPGKTLSCEFIEFGF